MEIPTYDSMMNPLLQALHLLGGSGTIEEINNKTVELMSLPDSIIEIPHGKSGSMSEVDYRLAWTKTYLKKYGLLENSARGIWSLIEIKDKPIVIDPKEVVKAIREKESKDKTTEKLEEQLQDTETEINERTTWIDHLNEVLLSIEPSQFERLTQRLLRESGFTQVEVTGKSGDGGIDGKGIMKIGGLLSFHVLFQCKRYKGVVAARDIRDFRGALQGRADKGLFITTGSFTRDAIKEAQRDGAPPIDLIDGNELAEKLKELSLGVKTELIEQVSIDEDWFRKI